MATKKKGKRKLTDKQKEANRKRQKRYRQKKAAEKKAAKEKQAMEAKNMQDKNEEKKAEEFAHGVAADEQDGVVVIQEAKISDVSEIPHQGNFSFRNIKTGRIVQGGGVKGAHHYAVNSADASNKVKGMFLRKVVAQGYEKISGIACIGVPGDVWRCKMEQHEKNLKRRKAIANDEYVSPAAVAAAEKARAIGSGKDRATAEAEIKTKVHEF